MIKNSIIYYWKCILSHTPMLLVYNRVDKKRTRKMLLKAFSEKRVPFTLYCLNGGMPEDTVVMARLGFFWQCYYTEHGKKWDIRIFISENQACFYMFYSVISTYKESNKINITGSERTFLEKFCYAGKGFVKL